MSDETNTNVPAPEAPVTPPKKKPTDRVTVLLTIGGIEKLCEDQALATCETSKVLTALGDNSRKLAGAIGRLKSQGLVEESEDKKTLSLTETGMESYKLAFQSMTGTGKPKGKRRAAASRSKYTFAEDATIEKIVDNPKRAGSMAHTRYELYKVGMSKEEALQALIDGDESCDRGKAATDLKFNIEHGFITMTGQEEVKPEPENEGGDEAPKAEGAGDEAPKSE